jgi:hypothetical protein
MIIVLPLAAIANSWEVGAGVLVLMVLAAWAIHELSRPSSTRQVPDARPAQAPNPAATSVPVDSLKRRKPNLWLTGVALIVVFAVYSTVFYVLPPWVFVAVWVFGALVTALSRRREGIVRGFLLALLGGPLWIFVATHLDAQEP